MEDRLIRRIQKVLVEWNPLGDKKHTILDLNDYHTEAIDIAFQLGLVNSQPEAREAIRTVLNQAFDLDLSPVECKKPAKRIWARFNRLRAD